MADIKLSLDGDLDLSSGGLEVATGSNEARQRIDLAINLNLGEFFSHINYGLPWIKNPNEDVGGDLRYFLGDKLPNPDTYVKGELDRYLESLPIVASLESSTEFDRSTRQFEYNFSVVTTEGEEINFPPYLQQL
jgi:hypothetical protein